MITRILRKQNMSTKLMRPFSKFINDSSSMERPISDRVVSTPEWPVPYYQRLYRAYPVRDHSQPDLSAVGADFGDLMVWHAKEDFGRTQEGRDIIAHVEDNIELDSMNFLSS